MMYLIAGAALLYLLSAVGRRTNDDDAQDVTDPSRQDVRIPATDITQTGMVGGLVLGAITALIVYALVH